MKKRILLVDDDTEFAGLLSDNLKGDGYEVLQAPSVPEFREHALHAKPHLIILDILLGEHNGPEVYKQLLIEGLDRGTPVIFLSALIPVSSSHLFPVNRGRKYMMRAKPCHYSDLLNDIRLLLHNRENPDFSQTA
jgi:DNA-binding response OmpR family regulator